VTANRWWVQAAARWLARIDGVKGQIQMFSLAVTAFSTFLQGFGLGGYVPYLAVVSVLSGVVYVYLYTEGGVWNQVQRDKADLSSNFAGPNMAMTAELYARAIAASERGEPLSESERQAVKTEVRATWPELRDGVDIEDLDS